MCVIVRVSLRYWRDVSLFWVTFFENILNMAPLGSLMYNEDTSLDLLYNSTFTHTKKENDTSNNNKDMDRGGPSSVGKSKSIFYLTQQTQQ